MTVTTKRGYDEMAEMATMLYMLADVACGEKPMKTHKSAFADALETRVMVDGGRLNIVYTDKNIHIFANSLRHLELQQRGCDQVTAHLREHREQNKTVNIQLESGENMHCVFHFVSGWFEFRSQFEGYDDQLLMNSIMVDMLEIGPRKKISMHELQAACDSLCGGIRSPPLFIWLHNHRITQRKGESPVIEFELGHELYGNEVVELNYMNFGHILCAAIEHGKDSILFVKAVYMELDRKLPILDLLNARADAKLIRWLLKWELVQPHEVPLPQSESSCTETSSEDNEDDEAEEWDEYDGEEEDEEFERFVKQKL